MKARKIVDALQRESAPEDDVIFVCADGVERELLSIYKHGGKVYIDIGTIEEDEEFREIFLS